MVTASLQRWTGVLGLLVLAGSAFGQTPIDRKMRQKDRRLDTPVSVSADRMNLGELMEVLSAKSHVVLEIDPKDPLSGIEILCDLKRMPLADAMNALTSLLGSKNGAWEWVPDTRQTPLRYSLHPPKDGQVGEELLKRARQEAFENLADLILRLNAMTPEQRKANHDKITPAMQVSAPEFADVYSGIRLVSSGGEDHFWAGITLFGDLLSPEQRRRVLRGEEISASLHSASEKALQAARTLNAGHHSVSIDANGVRTVDPPADGVYFRRSTTATGDPSLAIAIATGRSMGWEGYFGIRSVELVGHIAEDWLLPGDRAALPADRAPLTHLTAARPDSIWDNAPLPDRNIAQLADARNASFMAVVPGTTPFPLLSPTGDTIAQCFDDAWKRTPHLMHKWHEGILLVSYPSWFYGNAGAVSYDTLKRLRTSARKQNGLLSLEDIAEPITTLSAAQRRKLSAEFPPIGTPFDSSDFPHELVMFSMRPDADISAFYMRYPKALTEEVPVDAEMQAFLQKLHLWVLGMQPEEHMATVRIIDSGDRTTPGVAHSYALQFTTSRPRTIDGGARFQIRRIEAKSRP
ncbi:MAG: hypothetical protein JWN14_2690 [Chthonomonadales bacterium]|nr:hypothetical protein [Chthonomonadales bacterium]